MSSFLIFTAKELREQIRTYRGLVILAVLIVFGMTSPLTAKLTPELIKLAGAGIKIDLPAPTYLDAYAQFIKNIGQIALIVLMLTFSGCVSGEVSHGTAQIILTKRLSRGGFILSKYLSAAAVWTVSYASAACLCVVYTVYLFPQGKPSNLLLSLACMWLFGLLLLAGTVFASSLFSSYPLSALGAFAVWGALLLLSMIGKIKKYLPTVLGSGNVSLIGGSSSPADMRLPAIVCVLLTALLLGLACALFRRREL